MVAPYGLRASFGLRSILYGDWNSDHHDIVYTYPNGAEGWLLSMK